MHICGNAYHKRTYDGGIQGVCPVDNCRNIYNDNPFTEENTGYLRNIAKYSLYSFIISMILQIIFSLISNIEIDINFGGTSIMTILILYATTYVFEYGTKLQEKSSEKIYS